MLKESNITVLGGEVEALVEINTLDAMVEKCLYVYVHLYEACTIQFC